MPRVKFSADYDHDWPSGAVTRFRNNWEGSVKTEVAERAVRLGVARRVKLVDADPALTVTTAPGPKRRRKKRTAGIEGGKIDQAPPEARLPGNLPAELAEPQALTPNLHQPDES